MIHCTHVEIHVTAVCPFEQGVVLESAKQFQRDAVAGEVGVDGTIVNEECATIRAIDVYDATPMDGVIGIVRERVTPPELPNTPRLSPGR